VTAHNLLQEAVLFDSVVARQHQISPITCPDIPQCVNSAAQNIRSSHPLPEPGLLFGFYTGPHLLLDEYLSSSTQ
jgi:hypothetical protein